MRVLQGHVLDVLEGLPAGSVHACVTSPPYWMLRNYGSPPQVWPDGWVGELGQEDTPERYVDHLVAVFRAVKRVLRDDGTLWVNLAGCFWNDAGGQNGGGQPALGAGSVLHAKQHDSMRISAKAMEANKQQGRTKKGGHPVYKALDYVDVPGLVARALQADGWLWRSDVALVKSAPMPESVSGTRFERCRVKRSEGDQSPGTGQRKVSAVRDGQHGNRDVGSFESTEARAEWADCPGCPRCAPNEGLILRRGSGRPTRAWERLLVLAKKPGYYFDCEAIREPNTEGSIARFASNPVRVPDKKYAGMAGITPPAMNATEWRANGRNLRDWLLWRPQPLKAIGEESEHYAAYPTFIPELAVKAGTSARGCCPTCGAPWARVVERGDLAQERPQARRAVELAAQRGLTEAHLAAVRAVGAGDVGRAATTQKGENAADTVALAEEAKALLGGYFREFTHSMEQHTVGWRPTCACPPHAPVPCTLLDCFGGSGTSGIVADRLGRDAVLVELKPAYAKLAERRLDRDAPLLMWGQVTLEGGDSQATPQVVPLPVEEPQDAVAGG